MFVDSLKSEIKLPFFVLIIEMIKKTRIKDFILEEASRKEFFHIKGIKVSIYNSHGELIGTFRIQMLKEIIYEKYICILLK